MDLGTIWASVGLKTAPLAAGVAQAKGMMSGLDASLAATAKQSSFTASSIGAGFATIGKTAGTALAVVGVAAVKMAVDFDDSLHKAGAVAEATDAQMQDWGKTVLDMSTKFPMSAKEMADALYWIKSDMPDATDAQQFETLRIATEGAVGGVAELGDATEALIVVQNAYASSGVELAGPKDYMDAMMVSVQRGSITLQDFVANMGKVTGTAAMAKVPFTEISAAVATLTRKAVPADTAFMALNQTMITYLEPTAEASALAQQLGIDLSLTGLRTKGLAGSMMELADKVPDTELANLFPNIRALKAVLPLAGVSVQDFTADLNAMGVRAGTTDEMFKVQSESMKNKFIVTLNDLKKVLIEVGTSAFPTLEKAAEGLGSIFKGQNEVFNNIGGVFRTGASLALSFAGALTSVKPAIYGVVGALAGLKLVGLFSTGPSTIAGGLNILHTAAVNAAPILGATAPLITAIGATGLIAAAGLAEFIAVTWDDEQAAQATADAHVKLIESHGKLAESTLPLVAKLEELRKAQSNLAAGTPEYAAAQQEITNLQNQIAGNFPSLVAGWDSERNAILLDTNEMKENLRQRMAMGGVKTTPGAPAEYQDLEAILSKTEKASSRFTQMTGQVKGLNSALVAAGVSELYLGDVTDAWYESGDKGATVTTMLMSQLKDAGQLTTNEFKNLTGRVSELRNESNIWGGSLGYLNTQIKTLGPEWTAAVAEMASKAQEAGKAGAEIPQYVTMAFMSAVPEMQTAGVQAMSGYLQGVGAAAGLLPETAGNLAQQLFNTGTFTATGVAAVDQALQAMSDQMAKVKFDKTVGDAWDSALAGFEKFTGAGEGQVIKIGLEIDKTPAEAGINAVKEELSGYDGTSASATMNTETAQASQNVTGLKVNIADIKDKGVTASAETSQASQNVSGLKNNIAGLQDKTIHITALTNTVVNPTFDYPEDAGKYMAEKLQEGAGKVKPRMTMAAGIPDPTSGLAGAQAALTSTFGSFISEMNAAPIKEITDAMIGLATADWASIDAKKAERAALDALNAPLERNIKQHELDISIAQGALAADPANETKKGTVAQLEAEKATLERSAAEAKLRYELNQTAVATKANTGASTAAWNAANAAYKQAEAGLAKYTNAIKSHEGTIASLNSELAKLDAQTAKYNSQIEKLDESTKPYEKQIRDLDDALKVLDKSMQDSDTRASDYQKTLDKFSSMKLAGEGAASDTSFAQDEESKKLQLEIMKAEDAHNYALVAKLTLEKEALDRKKEEADLQTSITYDPQRRELEELLDPLHGQEATEAEIVAQITAAQAGLDAEKTIQEALKLQQDGIKAKQEEIALAVRNITDQEELLRAKVEIIEDKQEVIRAKIAAQDRAVAKLNKEYDKAKAKIDAFKKQIDDLASFFVSKYGDMKNAVTDLNNAIGSTAAVSGTSGGSTRVAALSTPAGGGTTVVHTNLHLDGKVLAKTVTKIQGGNASAYAMSGGRY